MAPASAVLPASAGASRSAVSLLLALRSLLIEHIGVLAGVLWPVVLGLFYRWRLRLAFRQREFQDQISVLLFDFSDHPGSNAFAAQRTSTATASTQTQGKESEATSGSSGPADREAPAGLEASPSGRKAPHKRRLELSPSAREKRKDTAVEFSHHPLTAGTESSLSRTNTGRVASTKRRVRLNLLFTRSISSVFYDNATIMELVSKAGEKTTVDDPILSTLPIKDSYIIGNDIAAHVGEVCGHPQGCIAQSIGHPVSRVMYVFAICFLKHSKTATRKFRVYVMRESLLRDLPARHEVEFAGQHSRQAAYTVATRMKEKYEEYLKRREDAISNKRGSALENDAKSAFEQRRLAMLQQPGGAPAPTAGTKQSAYGSLTPPAAHLSVADTKFHPQYVRALKRSTLHRLKQHVHHVKHQAAVTDSGRKVSIPAGIGVMFMNIRPWH